MIFPINKNVCWTLSENQRKASKKYHERYKDLTQGTQNKKRQYVRERYRNLSEEEKNKK